MPLNPNQPTNLNFKLCYVLDRLSVFVNIRRRYCRTGWAKN